MQCIMPQTTKLLLSIAFVASSAFSPKLFAQDDVVPELKTCAGTLVLFPVKNIQGEYVGEGHAREYLPDAANPVKESRMVVMPPTGGENALDRAQANNFCEAGYLTHVLTEWPEIEYEYNDVRMHDATGFRIQDTFHSLISSDNRPVGILGTSLGGILSTSIIPLEPRVAAAVFVVTGVDLPYIISRSDQRYVKAQRKARMKEYKLKTTDEYEALMAQEIHHDPKDALAVAIDLPPSLHIIAMKDTTVPTVSQEALAELFPNPEIIRMKGGHISTVILSTTSKNDEILDFVERQLH